MSDKESPSYIRNEYKEMLPRWELISQLLETKHDIRNSPHRQKIIPSMPAEDKDVYEDRVKNTFLWNSVEQTLGGMVGLITANGCSVDAIKNEELRKQVLQPTKGKESLKKFTSDLTKAVCQYGHALILVSPPENNLKSKADELKSDMRPYWSIYIPENVLNWRLDETGLAKNAHMIVLREFIELADGTFGVKTVPKYLVLRKGGATVYVRDEEVGEDRIVGMAEFKDSKGNMLREIPAVMAYYSETAPFVSKPPLNSLANQSLEHTRLKSNSNLAIRMHQFPVAVFKGLRDEDAQLTTIKLGPTVGLQLPEDADFKFEETNGSALNVGLKQIEKNEELQNEMSFKHLIGDKNISRDVSAAEALTKNFQKLSPLAKAAYNLTEAVNQAIQLHAKFLNIELDTEERFTMNFDIKNMSISTDQVRVMIELVQSQIIPRSVVFEKLSNGTWFDIVETYEQMRLKIDEENMDNGVDNAF